MRCLLLLALPGCLLATPTETTTALGVRAEPPIVGPPGEVALRVTESYATVHVDASRARRCYQELRGTYAHHSELEPGLLTGSLLGELVIAIANVAASDTTYEDRIVSVRATDCPIAARATVIELQLPSGRKIRTATNAEGLVSIAVPASEPPQGIVVVRSSDSEARIAYSRGLEVAAAPAYVRSQPVAARRP